MALHIKTFCIATGDGTLYADLQYAQAEGGDYLLRVRISRRKGRERTEHHLGFAGVNRAAELVDLPKGLSEHERDLIETEIRAATQGAGRRPWVTT